jgi:ParB/RepB/Spo0J family partition protein
MNTATVYSGQGRLANVDVDLIDRNPENPRIIFRPREMAQLMESIRNHGVQVPVSVYKDGKRFVLIDGERRWKASIKLNRSTIPALVQEKPDALGNLLLMFNIHALREQWDLLTIALKLPRVIELLRERLEREPNERDIAGETGLAQGVIRRCRLLIDLPDVHKQTILQELQRPKSQQRFTEDFFIEMERALKTVERAMPDVVEEFGKETIRENLIDKYQRGVVNNIVHFRSLAKIARAERAVQADATKARRALRAAFSRNSVSIEKAYEDSVAPAYSERDLVTRVSSLAAQLREVTAATLDDAAIAALRDLSAAIRDVLRGR